MLISDCVNTLSSVFTSLNDDRKANRFCDVVMRTGQKSFPVHRVVLSASSQYFQAMFSGNFQENEQREIAIREEDPDILEIVIEYCYTRKLEVTEETLPSVVEALDRFSVESAIKLLDQNLSNNIAHQHAALYLDIAVHYNGFGELKKAAAKCLCQLVLKDFEEYLQEANAQVLIELLKCEEFYSHSGAADLLLNWMYKMDKLDADKGTVAAVFASVSPAHLLADEFDAVSCFVNCHVALPKNVSCHSVDRHSVIYDYSLTVDSFEWVDVTNLRLESIAGRFSKKFSLGNDFILQFYGNSATDPHHNITGLKIWPEEDCPALGSYNIELLITESPLNKSGRNYRFNCRWCFTVSNSHPYTIYFDLDETLSYKVRVAMSKV